MVGAIFTSDHELAKKIRQIARHGQSRRYVHDVVGVNSRLDTIQAAVLLAKLTILDSEIQQRSDIAKYYRENIRNQRVIIPETSNKCFSSYAQFTLRSESRDKFRDLLEQKSIPTAVHYPLPLNKQKATRSQSAFVPVSELCSNSVFSIPVHCYMQNDSVEHIVQTINSI